MKRSRSGAETGPKTVNIFKFYPRVDGPTTAEPDDRPPNLFPNEQRILRAPHHNGGTYYLASSGRDGELRASCTHCTFANVNIKSFAPQECLRNNRKRAAFFEALSDYYRAYQARDYEAAAEARQRVVDNRTDLCRPCQESGSKLSPAQKACKYLYNDARGAACIAQDGCRHPHCVERGPQAVCVLQGDHIDPSTKVHRPGDYIWWSWNGGVEALRKELPKLQWPCAFCHHLEETGDQANRCGDPKEKPEGKSKGTPEEVKQYDRRRHAIIKYPKQKYVDEAKMAIGACAHCKRGVTPETVWCFHFDHIDEVTKLIGKNTLAGVTGGVAGIVCNLTKAAALDAPGVKEALDEEIAKCQLLCVNCHHRKTHDYPQRE